ncbi:MAG TPA: hypothetical protein DCZ03_15830, partial [Gammaproteobacteria bacterium]|nr:hypothetical protein [Gammaproteobacteria bacterium]
MTQLLFKISTRQMWGIIGVSTAIVLVITLALLVPLGTDTLDARQNYAQLNELLKSETHPAEQLKKIEQRVADLDKKL